MSSLYVTPLIGFAPPPSHISQSYRVDVCDDGVYVHTHLNGVSVVGIGASHPLRRASSAVSYIDWNVGGHDRSAVHVSGKRKRGTVALDSCSRLCNVVCVDGSVYDVRAGVRGRLIQVNARLNDDANMIQNTERADSDGFIAVVQRFSSR